MTSSDRLKIKTDPAEGGNRFLAFSLCDEQYAMPLLRVKEVIGMTAATPIPRSPNYFHGVVNLRGQVISVIDLRTKLQLPKKEAGPETSIIILDLASPCLGVIVDSINCVLSISGDEISPASDFEFLVKERHFSGVAKKDGRLTLLLEIESTLNIEDIQKIQNTKAA